MKKIRKENKNSTRNNMNNTKNQFKVCIILIFRCQQTLEKNHVRFQIKMEKE